jgi:DNA-directed RNA polymerase subunit RPC12/RpoP
MSAEPTTEPTETAARRCGTCGEPFTPAVDGPTDPEECPQCVSKWSA